MGHTGYITRLFSHEKQTFSLQPVAYTGPRNVSSKNALRFTSSKATLPSFSNQHITNTRAHLHTSTHFTTFSRLIHLNELKEGRPTLQACVFLYILSNPVLIVS